jgi:hypothetical protein
MGRRAIKIDKTDLVKVIAKMESEQAFSKQTDLWNALAKHYGVSNTHIYQLVKKLKIEVKTAKGQRGMALKAWRDQSVDAAPPSRMTRSEKIAASPEAQEWINGMQKDTELRRYGALIEGAEAGSLRAVVALKCLDCTAGQRIDIKECVCTSCPLWFYRPYKKDPNDAEVQDEKEVDVEIG